MAFSSLPRPKISRSSVLSVFVSALLTLSLTAVWQTGSAQQARLSLADILIGLRSKKVSLVERNRLLTDAVNTRGVTFALTPEIEKELVETGAGVGLVAAIRRKSLKPEVAPLPKPSVAAIPLSATPPVAVPIQTPAPDFAFYRKRADENAARGEIDRALEDYNQALKLNPKDALAYLNRGRALNDKKYYDRAIADFAKAIEFNPKETAAYFSRANAYEKIGDAPKAVGDYQKTLELEPDNEAAKTNLSRLKTELAKAAPPPVKQETPQPTLAAPTSIEMGELNALALDLVKPSYSEIARKSNVQGLVTVQISLDDKGKVISAKAVSGHPLLRAAAENAASRSKFKPAVAGSRAVKATGYIVYNFISKP